ncbi:MAG: molybdopterin biosynthesis protein [Pseudolabrys sp.]|nr:molybdopterin biosynthesis protein [Pseudolabrys sp.]MDP2297103.1 molybdopterin biosynthesis protein [Pseudolabrys sp.]
MKDGQAQGREIDLIARVRAAARQEQFLDVVSAEEARERFERHLDLSPLPAEKVALADALTRVLAHDIIAAVDAPPFDRSNVDGFALRAVDTLGATNASPKILRLNAEVIACGDDPALEIAPGTATTIATGGVIPRGADAVIMVEQTELIGQGEPYIEVQRAATPGQFVSYAGSDIARGETLLRRGVRIGSREIGMLAACGLAFADVVRRPKVAVLSTGDELVPLGQPLKPAGIYDSNGAIIAAAVAEAGGVALPMGAIPDDAAALDKAVREALSQSDMVVLSAGTSKGAGDLSHAIVSRLGAPGILVHGVALKPGKPLCLGVIGKTPIAVLPGFPTSAIFTFHAFIAPVIRALAGLPPEAAQTIQARVPVRVASELGRKEFVLVSLIDTEDGPVAFPTGKGSGSVTSFSQADGFIEIDALASSLDTNTITQVTLIGSSARAPDLVIMGSHDVALDVMVGALADRGFSARTLAVGSLGGVAAASRGECDIAPVHLIDPASDDYNKHLVTPALSLVAGWRRMQGVLFRTGDARFEGKSAAEAIKAALADSAALMVNRNAGAGTRVLIDTLLNGARPPGYANQPKSHNAVAASIAQGRADWGVAIEPVAKLYGLGFLPVAPEHYDFLVVESRRDRPAVRAFLAALRDEATRSRIAALGMVPADG